MKRVSIGLRLTLWYFAFFSLALVLFGTSMWFSVRHSMFRVIKQNLNDNVQGVQRFLEDQPADSSLSRLQRETIEEYSAENEGDYLQIVDEQGNVLYQAQALRAAHSPDLSDLRLLPSGRYKREKIQDGQFLFLSKTITAHGKKYSVLAGMPLRDLYGSLARFREDLLLFVPLVLIVASAFGYWMSRRALRPVREITIAARSIGAQNLSKRLTRLETGDELQLLSETLNEMLARLEQSFARIAQFTADASHELRTPISLIRTEAEVAMRKSRTESEYRATLQHILAEAERTTHLVEELLSLARTDSGAENLTLQLMDVGSAVCESAENWRQVAEEKGLRFTTELLHQPISVQADRAAFLRVLAILLDNAVRYTSSPGYIKIFDRIEGDSVLLSVEDSGIGISESELPRIFERFYRADPARNRQSGGAGLGLAIAQWIVKQHNGTISVNSVLGHGSTFTVRLPVAAISSENTERGTYDCTSLKV